MFNSITNYLEKFQKMDPPERSIKRTAVECVYEQLNISINPEDISLKQGVIYIKSHPAIKSEISLNRDSIIQGIMRKIGANYNIVDLR